MADAKLLTVLTLLILILALPLLSLLTGLRIRAVSGAGAVKYFRYARTIVILWSLTALALYALRLHGLGPADVGVRPPHHVVELGLGLVAVVSMLFGIGASRRVLSHDYARALRAVVPADPPEWAWFIPVAASAGICEEFLYRGYALSVIAALTGSIVAGAVLSSFAFGFGHAYQGRTGIIGATVSGLLYAAVFIATGSLYPCMLGHFVQDIAGAVVLSRSGVLSNEGRGA